MRVIDIVPKDIVIVTEFSIENIQAILYCLDRCQVLQDVDDPSSAEKIEYFTKTFFKVLCELEEKLKSVT